jgi:hypothetical protein
MVLSLSYVNGVIEQIWSLGEKVCLIQTENDPKISPEKVK